METKKDVLDAVVHERLIQDIKSISEMSGIPALMIRTSMADYCAEPEKKWVREFQIHRAQGSGGLCLVGGDSATADDRLKAIGAALIRNFIDARVYMLNELIDMMDTGDTPSPTVMLLPSFYLGSYSYPEWKVQKLHELLMHRVGAAKQTVLYVENLTGMNERYGTAITQYIKAHWLVQACKQKTAAGE